MLSIGDVAPEFTVPDHEGRTVRLAELRGKRVILWFYPTADTGGWTAEGLGFRDRKADFDAKGIVILGASVDDRTDNAKFAKKNSFNFPLLCDTDRKLCLAYHAVENSEGRARRISYLIGADGRIEIAWPKVKAGDHPEEVLKAIG